MSDLHRKSRYNSKTYRKLLSSSILTVIIPLVLSVIVSMMLLSYRNDYVNKLYYTAASSVNDVFLHIMDTICGQFNSLATNSRIREYSMTKTRRYWNEVKIYETLLSTVTNNKDIRNAVLYLEQYNLFLSNIGAVNTELYCRISGISQYNDYMDMFRSAAHNMQVTTADDGRVYVVQNLYKSNDGKYLVALAFEIDVDSLCGQLRLRMVDDDDEIIITADGVRLLSSSDIKLIGPGLGEKVGGSDYRVFSSGSNAKRYECLYLAAKDDPAIQNASSPFPVLCLMMSIVLTVVLAVLMTARNYSPVKKISEMLDLHVIDRGTDEYENIEKTVLKYENQIQNLRQAMDNNADALRAMYLEKLLLGNITNQNTIRQGCRLYGIDFPLDGIVFLTIDLDIMSDIDNEEADKIKLMQSISSLIEPVAEKDAGMYILETNGMLIYVLNTNNTVNKEKKLTDIMTTLNSLTGYSIPYSIVKGIPEPTLFHSYFSEAQHQLEMTVPLLPKDIQDAESAGDTDINVEACIKMIEDSYSNAGFGVTEMSLQLRLNPAYISRIFKQQTGIGPLEYLNRYRISIARQIITENPDVRIKELAAATGFNSEATLIRVFKKYEGITPGKYKMECESSESG